MGDCLNAKQYGYYYQSNSSSNNNRKKNTHKSVDDKTTKRYSRQLQNYDYYSKKYAEEYEDQSSKICGIINLGNNCYLNSGLQIIASCNRLVYELQKTNNAKNIVHLIKDAIYRLLNEKIYNPNNFINYFCSYNSDFIRGAQCCSQNFIRTLIRNINDEYLRQKLDLVSKNEQYNPSIKEENEYKKFISRIFPESKVQSLFSNMTKSFSKDNCKYCHKDIQNFSFSYYIDYNLYLDEIRSYRCDFSHILDLNIGNSNILTMDCPYCKREIYIKEETKFIKLPDIFIFTLERYQGETNNVEIIPDPFIYMDKYIDPNLKVDNTKYELFAINIRYGRTSNFGHEICQVKRDGIWYEINDKTGNIISNPSHYDCSYGLFYKKANQKFDSSKPGINTKLDLEEVYKSSESFKLDGKFNNMGYGHDEENHLKFSKINNYGHKYLNSGLEIISSFDEFKAELNRNNIRHNCIIKIMKNAIEKILNKKVYDAYELIESLPKKKSQREEDNSQSFIIKIIDVINKEFLDLEYKSKINIQYSPIAINNAELKEYKQFLTKKEPISRALSIFLCISKTHSFGSCDNCYKKYEYYSFNSENQQIIDIDTEIPGSECTFFELLNRYYNLSQNNKIDTNCPNPKCQKKMVIIGETKIVQLPDIFIFTIKRNGGYRDKKIKIKPDPIIYLKNFIDPYLKENYKYELFAVNIKKKDFDICQIKRDGKWYEIDQKDGIEIQFPESNDSSYGLFYRRLKNPY